MNARCLVVLCAIPQQHANVVLRISSSQPINNVRFIPVLIIVCSALRIIHAPSVMLATTSQMI